MELAAICMLIVLIALMVIGMPITWALGGAVITALMIDDNLSLALITQKMFSGCDNFSMLALPAFFLAGDIMAKGGLSRRLVNFADNLVGWISGGISLVSIVACTFFAAISGSSVATTAAIGGIMYPEMVKRGYPKAYSAAVQAIGGTLGIVIPPSTVFVIYGNVTNTSVAELLMAGIVPGVICGIALCIWAYIKAKKEDFPRESGFSFIRFLKSFKSAIWALLMPIVILGGIYSGIFTPTESAVIAVFYGFVVCLGIYRELSGKATWKIIQDSSVTTANIMFLVVTAQMFGYLLTYYRIPVYVTQAFMSVASNQFVFMALIIVLLTICGMFIEVGATNLILGPILAPIAVHFGVDPVHFGLVFVFLLAMGQATPPFGTTLFVACGISKESVARVSRAVLPFVVVEILCAILFAYVPVLSTGITYLMK
ncbi:MAG: TRAP transporter large permease [Proteobacteria bacterium]|uniref:TRAP transporter large permease protein n=1 Tax=Candidatus Avisuccinivibrio stercorigallinarum TaxID=2840704 RepID=A0A9D9GUT1_9GAMM|nr:TRAP transporter large permease [Candidatus Avisuccinivibrio stercorigallinarum]